MSGPIRGAGRYRALFVNPESTFGTDPDGYPVAADACRLVNASVSLKHPTGARVDANGTAGKDGSIPEKGTVELQIEVEMLASGTAGTSPDWADLLAHCGGFTATVGGDTTISGTSSGATTINVVDASGTAVGGFITVAGETRLVTARDTGSSPNTYTVAPDFTTAPTTAGVAVTGGIGWAPNSDSDATPDGCTIWLGNNAHLFRARGVFATSVRASFGGTGSARLSFSCVAASAHFLYTDTLNGSINDTTTTITVSDASARLVPADVSASNPFYFTIDKGAATEEYVKVTAKSGADLTVVRASPSGSASSHADGATIEPYQPAGTWAGSPVPATGGNAILGGVVAQIESGSWDCDMGRQMVEGQHGSAWNVTSYVNGMRTITAQMEAYGTNANTDYVRDAINQGSIPEFMQQGTATGSIVGAYSPAVYNEVPDTALSEDTVNWTLSGNARTGSVGGEDEVRFFHG